MRYHSTCFIYQLNVLPNFVLVCMQVKIHINYKQNDTLFSRKWHMGSCFGPRGLYTYESFTRGTYLDRCCLKPGIYTLVCKNSKSSYGWGSSYIEIQGQRYCDDFVGSKAMRRIFLLGE